jgi:hypothetical protein
VNSIRNFYSRLPKSLTTVTTFSKLIALFLFILLPLAGFLIGIKYQAAVDFSDGHQACTQEAKICPDGTSVGRTGPNCEFTECPAPTTSQTADWKVYTEDGFSFKYPSNGTVNLQSSNVYISSITEPYFIFTIKADENPNHLTSKQVAEQMMADLRNNPNVRWGKTQADETIKTMKEYSNGQISGLKLKSFDEGYPQGFGEVIDTTNTSIYTFQINDGNGSVSINEEQLLDQILSTFKFTDSNISPTPTCMKRPACLDSNPRCLIAEPANGWCP